MREKKIFYHSILKFIQLLQKWMKWSLPLIGNKIGSMFDIGKKLRVLEKTYVENIYMEMHQYDVLENEIGN